jgi:hypothetical protein
MTKGSSSAPAWTPREVADRCEALGARVELKGAKYRVYPPRGGGPVFFNAQRETNGSHLSNVLRDLRRLGLDLAEAEREIQERRSTLVPTAVLTVRDRISPETQAAIKAIATEAIAARSTTPTTEQEPPMAAPKPTPPTSITFNVRQEIADLRETLRRQGDTALEMLASAERRIAALEAEVAELRGRGGLNRGPSTSELVRRSVLAWFIAHPGMRITPQVLEMNLDGQLPEGYGKTMVAGGCRDLTHAGRLQGGGTKAGEAPSRGVYWYDPDADEAGDGEG